jgi:hypothetical protein
MFLIPELAIERWLFHDGRRSMTVDLSVLRPPWKRQRVFGIDCSRSWRQADSMLIGRWTARSMRPPKRFVRLARRCLQRCDADLSEGRCESRSTVWVGRPHGAGSVGALVQDARRGTPSMLVPSSCRLGKSSNFLKRPLFWRHSRRRGATDVRYTLVAVGSSFEGGQVRESPMVSRLPRKVRACLPESPSGFASHARGHRFESYSAHQGCPLLEAADKGAVKRLDCSR